MPPLPSSAFVVCSGTALALALGIEVVIFFYPPASLPANDVPWI
jgi:hypothetical protein